MNSTKREIVEMWLLKNQDIINYAGLDKRLGFPNGTFQKFFKYGRKLNKNRLIRTYRFLTKIGVDVNNNIKDQK